MSRHWGLAQPSQKLFVRTWDDLRVSPALTKRLGNSDPSYTKVKDNGAGSVGVYGTQFATGNEVFFEVQLPHNWFEGSSLHPHVHWICPDANAGNVAWKLEYTIADIDGTFGNTTILANPGPFATPGVAFKHTVSEWTEISMTGLKISNILLCRFFRDATGDTYGSNPWAISIDFHYQIDSLGSRNELTK